MKRFGLIGLVALLLLSLILAVMLGTSAVAPGKVLQVLGYQLFPNWLAAPASTDIAIIWHLRLPRALLAGLVGGGLSIVGVAMQTLVRNPLAEPYLLGLSSGASAGASLYYLGFLPAFLSASLSLSMSAFLGGLVTMAIVYAVAQENGHIPVTRLLLAGVAMAALMGAISTFVMFASPELDKMKTVMFWMLGSLAGVQWSMLLWPAVAVSISLVLLIGPHRILDALLLGDDAAASLGLPVEWLKRGLIVLSALVTGALVASAGAIGFVGLIVPHAVRSVVGVTHKHVVPASFLAGAIFLILADLAARLILPGRELPIGILTAICGVPFFLILLRRRTYRFG